MTDKIFYFPKEGTTGFWGLRGYPMKPLWTKDDGLTMGQIIEMENEYEEKLESCKSNRVEIVNMSDHFQMFRHPDGSLITEASLNELAPGDIFDLPEGFQFKEEQMNCKKWCGGYGCLPIEKKCHWVEHPKKVLRLVKTETRPKINTTEWEQAQMLLQDEQSEKLVYNGKECGKCNCVEIAEEEAGGPVKQAQCLKPSEPASQKQETFGQRQRLKDKLQKMNECKPNKRNGVLLGAEALEVPQPEPEESQDHEVQIVTNIDLVTTASIAGYNKGVSDFKSAIREEIEKEKVKRGQPSEDLEVGKIIGLQIALQLLDSVTPKK